MVDELTCKKCGGPISRGNLRCPRCNSLTVSLGCSGRCSMCMKAKSCGEGRVKRTS